MKIIDIALKDLLRSFRSLFMIGMTIAAPLMLTGLIYFAFGGMSGGDVSLTPIKVGLVNADKLISSYLNFNVLAWQKAGFVRDIA